jgi:hypothetical protein
MLQATRDKFEMDAEGNERWRVVGVDGMGEPTQAAA